MDNLQAWMVNPPAWTCLVALLLCGIIVGMLMKR